MFIRGRTLYRFDSFDTLKALDRVQIVGTDIDEKALQEAKRGNFIPGILLKYRRNYYSNILLRMVSITA